MSPRIKLVLLVILTLAVTGLSVTGLSVTGLAANALPAERVLAQAADDPKLPTIRIFFFTPADVEPPEGVEERLTEVAKYTEEFFVKWMTRWGYEPAKKDMFQWKSDGKVEVLFAKGDQNAEHYKDGTFRPKVVQQMAREHNIPRNGNINWFFVYVGDPPAKFEFFRGSGNSKAGGWAMLNYHNGRGRIRADQDIAAGFHDEFFLKGAIHEFGHALGLPHLGPRLRHDAGNTLMGPVTRIWRRELGRNDPRGYLSEGSAAMLWKHPIFSGKSNDRGVMPKLSLKSYQARYSQQNSQFEITGQVTSDSALHSIIVVDDMDQKPGEYWVRPYVSRVDEDGKFTVVLNEPVPSGGTFRIMFCFDNGVVTGNGQKHGLPSAIEKRYRYARGNYAFDR